MNNSKNYIAIDLGASATRYASSFNGGIVKTLSNKMIIQDDVNKECKLNPHTKNIDSSLEFVIEKEGDSDINCRVVAGQLANRMTTTTSKPDALSHKYEQRVNRISAVMAVSCAFIEANRDDEDIIVFVALPPTEVNKARENFEKVLCGKYKVYMPLYKDGVTVKFNITGVKIEAESSMAMVGSMFNLDLKKISNQFNDGCTLSLDIGASTTDLVIIEDGKYLERTGQTYKIGGNVAREYLIDMIRNEYGYDLPEDKADIAMIEGRLQHGNKYKNISDLVVESKKMFAIEVVNQMLSYFRKVNKPIQTIKSVVVSGGGSLESQYIGDNGEEIKTSAPMSAYITDKLKSHCDDIEIIHYGEQARIANVTGLYITAKAKIAGGRV